MSGRFFLAVTTVLSLSCAPVVDSSLAEAADRPSAQGTAEDLFDHAPAAEGTIERYLLDPRGEVEGLLLVDGAYMYVTSRAAEQLLRALKPGDHVRVYGRRGPDEGLVLPDVIKNLTRRTTFIVPIRLDLPMPEQESRLSVTELYASGTIRILLYHALKHMVQGLILSDETQVRLPPDTNEDLRGSLKVGDPVTVRGNGTINEFGRAIEALAIGRDPGSLHALDASLHRLP